jgi:hypothetical protein
LLIAGDHDPVNPFVAVVGSMNVPPLQIGDTCVNVGVVGELTVTVIVAVAAHCPAVGVNVYVVVAVLLFAGDQLPFIALLDVVGKVNVPPLQIPVTCVNAGAVG